MNPISPDRLSAAAERLAEVAAILAAGLMRLRARQSSRLSGDRENSCVDFTANQSGGAPSKSTRRRMHNDRQCAGPPGRDEDDGHARAEGQWRELFATEPPPYNRKFLESRLAYRIQELAYGGLKPETHRSGWRRSASSSTAATSPCAASAVTTCRSPARGCIREWQGVEHTVTVLADGYEWQGRPYKSLSAVARAITGTRWNGWMFFGLKNQRGRAQ